MQRFSIRNWATVAIPFDEASFNLLYREIVNASIRQGDKQDLARFRRKINLTGFISSAATTFAAMSSEDGKLFPHSIYGIRTSLVFNQDGSTMLARDDKKKNRMRTTKNARSRHRKNGFGNKSLSASASAKLQKMKDKPKTTTTVQVAHSEITPELQGRVSISIISSDSGRDSIEGSLGGTSDILSSIRRTGQVTRPIICTVESCVGSKYPPEKRKQAKRGIHFDIISCGLGIWLAAIVTLTEYKCQPGHHMYKLSDKLWVIFRPKVVNEVDMAMCKQNEVFFPAMHECREKIIKQSIDSHNSRVDLKIRLGNNTPGSKLTREEAEYEEDDIES